MDETRTLTTVELPSNTPTYDLIEGATLGHGEHRLCDVCDEWLWFRADAPEEYRHADPARSADKHKVVVGFSRTPHGTWGPSAVACTDCGLPDVPLAETKDLAYVVGEAVGTPLMGEAGTEIILRRARRHPDADHGRRPELRSDLSIEDC